MRDEITWEVRKWMYGLKIPPDLVVRRFSGTELGSGLTVVTGACWLVRDRLKKQANELLVTIERLKEVLKGTSERFEERLDDRDRKYIKIAIEKLEVLEKATNEFIRSLMDFTADAQVYNVVSDVVTAIKDSVDEESRVLLECYDRALYNNLMMLLASLGLRK